MHLNLRYLKPIWVKLGTQIDLELITWIYIQDTCRFCVGKMYRSPGISKKISYRQISKAYFLESWYKGWKEAGIGKEHYIPGKSMIPTIYGNRNSREWSHMEHLGRLHQQGTKNVIIKCFMRRTCKNYNLYLFNRRVQGYLSKEIIVGLSTELINNSPEINAVKDACEKCLRLARQKQHKYMMPLQESFLIGVKAKYSVRSKCRYLQ